MKTKAAKIFSCCKYELIIFIVLAVQALAELFPFNGVGEFTSVYYLADYSMGKASRLLVGSVFNLFTDNTTMENINTFALVVLFLTLLMVAVIVGRVVRNTEAELRPQLYLMILFFVSGSFTFAFFSKVLGLLDIYMFIAAVLAVVCSFRKVTRWLVPVICAIGVLIHNIFIVSYFPFVILTLFYFLIKENKKIMNSILLLASVAVTVGLTVYFTAYSADNMAVTFEEFCEIIRQKSSEEISDAGLYGIGFHLFNIAGDNFGGYTAGASVDMSFFDLVKNIMAYMFAEISLKKAASVIVISLLIFAVFWIIWIKCMKNTDSKGKKLIYLAFTLSSLMVFCGFVVTTDYIRWVQAFLLSQFGFAFMMFCVKDEPFAATMQQLRGYFKNKKFLLALIYMVYVLSVQTDLAV